MAKLNESWEDYGDVFDQEPCERCGGDGFIEECELECDWVNFGNDLVECPECRNRSKP